MTPKNTRCDSDLGRIVSSAILIAMMLVNSAVFAEEHKQATEEQKCLAKDNKFVDSNQIFSFEMKDGWRVLPQKSENTLILETVSEENRWPVGEITQVRVQWERLPAGYNNVPVEFLTNHYLSALGDSLTQPYVSVLHPKPSVSVWNEGLHAETLPYMITEPNQPEFLRDPPETQLAFILPGVADGYDVKAFAGLKSTEGFIYKVVGYAYYKEEEQRLINISALFKSIGSCFVENNFAIERDMEGKTFLGVETTEYEKDPDESYYIQIEFLSDGQFEDTGIGRVEYNAFRLGLAGPLVSKGSYSVKGDQLILKYEFGSRRYKIFSYESAIYGLGYENSMIFVNTAWEKAVSRSLEKNREK